MAEAPAAAPATEPIVAAPAADPAPAPNLVADATPAAPAAAPAPALTVAAVDPAVARTYLTEHGMTAEDAAKIPDADLAKKYDEAKTAEANKPIEYKDFKLPEGAILDPTLLSAIKADFAEAKLTQDQAQKLVDRHVAVAKAATDGQVKAWNDMQEGWRKEVMADPEIGGAQFQTKTSPAIAKAIETFGGDATGQKALRDIVSLTGIGNHPAYVKFMAKIGSSLMEGAPLSGKPPAGGPKNFDQMATTMYPNMGKTN